MISKVPALALILAMVSCTLCSCAPRIANQPADEKSYALNQESTARVGQPLLARTRGTKQKAEIWRGLLGGGWEETEWAFTQGAVHHELLYQGGNDKEIELGYREYRLSKSPLVASPIGAYGNVDYRWEPETFMAAPAFYQQVRYNKTPDRTQITYQSYVIEVVSADNSGIVYTIRSD